MLLRGMGFRARDSYLLLAAGLLSLIIVSSTAGCKNPRYIYNDGAIECGADGEPIELINSPDAKDPTYAELVSFIISDATDTRIYSETGFSGIGDLESYDPYVCADFAETVHNNAEEDGIRAAWVGIAYFGEEIGHAINAFKTTDKGLVFIDCTGGETGFMETLQESVEALKSGVSHGKKPASWDALAYVEVGKEYGLVPIDVAESTSYDFYEEYRSKWLRFKRQLDEYNAEVIRFNEEVRGKIFYVGSAESKRIMDWEDSLDSKEKELKRLSEGLSEFWFERPGIVSDIDIHWGED